MKLFPHDRPGDGILLTEITNIQEEPNRYPARRPILTRASPVLRQSIPILPAFREPRPCNPGACGNVYDTSPGWVNRRYAVMIALDSVNRLMRLLASRPLDCVEMILALVPESDRLDDAELAEVLAPMLAASSTPGSSVGAMTARCCLAA